MKQREIKFKKGDATKVISGPFKNHTGKVVEVCDEGIMWKTIMYGKATTVRLEENVLRILKNIECSECGNPLPLKTLKDICEVTIPLNYQWCKSCIELLKQKQEKQK